MSHKQTARFTAGFLVVFFLTIRQCTITKFTGATLEISLYCSYSFVRPKLWNWWAKMKRTHLVSFMKQDLKCCMSGSLDKKSIVNTASGMTWRSKAFGWTNGKRKLRFRNCTSISWSMLLQTAENKYIRRLEKRPLLLPPLCTKGKLNTILGTAAPVTKAIYGLQWVCSQCNTKLAWM